MQTRVVRARASIVLLCTALLAGCGGSAARQPPGQVATQAHEGEGLEHGNEAVVQGLQPWMREDQPEEVLDLKIDVHTHLFNAWDLPLADFLRKSKPLMTPFASILTKNLRSRAPRYRGDSCLRDSREPASPQEFCTEEEALEIYLRLVAEDPELRELVTQEATRGEERINWATQGPRVIRFVSAFHRSRTHQARTLATIYERIDLFAPAMVDMDGWAGKDARLLSVQDRIDALGNAILEMNRTQPGLFHPLVAFNPRHGIKSYPEYLENYHEIIEEALLERGFLGVKLYPGFGYFPLDNATMDTQGLKRPEHAEEVDRELIWLYTFAERNGIPILAHCTATGAELGKRHADVFGHPGNWESVLELFPRLRVGLGHFGKVTQLIKSNDPQSTWPVLIADMMEVYPSLYADLAYDGVANDDQFQRVLEALKDLMDSHPVVRTRLMYGTDWFTILLTKGSATYHERWDGGFTNELFGEETRKRFFGWNAVQFLGLDDERTRERLRRYYLARDLELPRWLADESSRARLGELQEN